MSSKRLFGISLFGAAVVICVVVFLWLVSFFRNDAGEMLLPDTRPVETPITDDAGDGGSLDLVEVTRATVQDVVKTLSRPEEYTREITFESFWEGGSAFYNITTAVSGGVTSLRVRSGGGEKRIIVTDNEIYIWYQGELEPYIGELGSSGDGYRTADEWQMLHTYEDLLNLDKNGIIDAGYTEYGGESCIYAVFKSPLLGYTTRYYVSIELGLITGAEEYDYDTPVSRMTTGDCVTGETDESLFTLPDGTVVR